MTTMVNRDFLNFVRFRTLLLALDCDDNAEVWIESTIRRADNGQPERDRVYKLACRDGRVVIFCDEGYGIGRDHPAPDFHCQGLLGDFFIEATTVNPSGEAPDVDAENRDAYFGHYVPMKYGSALFSKLRRRYWELPHVAGQPLVLAIQDFHAPYAMVWSNTGLVEYLYAIRQAERPTADGAVEIVSEPVTEYVWGDKPPIPAGFFLQPYTENISAVIANPGGTISKFNRIGFLAGFGGRDIMMMRCGYCYKGSTMPEWFVSEVHKPGYAETWCEGLSVYHNPNARIPLPPEVLPCAAHHTSRSGRVLSQQPAWHPVGSTTHVVVPMED